MRLRKKTPQYETIIFDFDGTIADTFEQFIALVNKKLVEKGKPAVTKTQLDHMKSAGTVFAAMDELGVPRWQLPILTYQLRRALKSLTGTIDIFDGVEPMLSKLFDHYTIGVVSSNSTENIETILKRHGIYEYFEFAIGGASMLGKHRKLKKVLKKKGLKKKHTLYVGDEVRDIIACQKIDLDIASASWGPTDLETLKSSKPTYVLKKPKDLLRILS